MLVGEVYALSTGYDYSVSMDMSFKAIILDIPLYIFTEGQCTLYKESASERCLELCLVNNMADIRCTYR